MSRKSLVPVNVPALASAPTTPTIRTGDLYFNTTDNTLYSYNGTTWAASSGGGGGGGASVTIDGTAPTSPTEGSLWFDSDTGQFFIYYDSYWLEVGAGSSAAPQAIISQASAPADTSALWLDTDEPAIETIPASIVDAKGDIVVATADNAPARLGVGANGSMLMANSNAASGLSWVGQYDVAGKNKVINGDFSINQRAFSSTTTAGAFTFDRFVNYNSNGTVTLSAQTFTLGAAPVAGYEAKNFLQVVTTGQTATSAAAIVIHKVEGVRTFAGQTTTFSFWARAGSGTPKVAVEVSQNFGNSGGSAGVNTYAGQVTLTTGWARYSVTVAVPSISGKTIGSANDDNIQIAIWTSAGSDFNSRTGSLGIQSNTIQTWGWQWESGSVATPFTLAGGGSSQAELALCYRYYVRKTPNAVGGDMYVAPAMVVNTTANALITIPMPGMMRANPTVTFSNLMMLYGSGSSVNISLNNYSSVVPGSMGLYLNLASAVPSVGIAGYIYGSTGSSIDFSAEL